MKSAKRRLYGLKRWRAAAVIAAALVLGGLAGTGWWWFRAAPALARYLPKDTQVYVEFPSITKALIGLSGVDAVDQDDLDPERQKKRLVEAFADSFELGLGNVDRFFDGIRAAAVAGRKGRQPEGVILFAFSSEGDVTKVLAAERFKKEDRFKGYDRYSLQRRDVDNPDALAKLSPLERALNQLGNRPSAAPATGSVEIVEKPEFSVIWFADEKVLALGSTGMVEDCARVANGEHESLEHGNELFEQAEWPMRSSLLAYVDPNLLDSREAREAFLDNAGPATGAIRFLDEGIGFDVRFDLRGTQIPDPKLFMVPTQLSLWERLPSDTIAYVAFSTRFASRGKDVERALFGAAASLDASLERELQIAFDRMHEETNIDFADLVEITGDQAVLAVVADDRALKSFAEGSRKDFTFVGIAEVSDKKRAAKVVRDLQDFLETRYDVSRKAGGFIAERDKQPSVLVKLSAEGHLLFAIGKGSDLEDFEDIYIGKGRSLLKDVAHEKAMAALEGRPLAFAWVDAGRATEAMLSRQPAGPEQENGSPRGAMKALEIPIDALDLDGPQRITAWAALFIRASDKSIDVEIKSLNAVTLAGLWALIEVQGDLFPSLKLSETGIPACDVYVATLRKCMTTASSSQKTTLESLLKTSLDQYKKATPTERDALGEQCALTEKSIKNIFDCK